jgi:leucine dehydrogenase
MIGVNDFKNVEGKTVFQELANNGHEQVVFCYDESTKLKAIISIHNTVLGPALGGTRMWQYVSESEAFDDVLRLARGMTFKAAISGLDLGGGKAVIIGDAQCMKTEKLLRRFGRFVEDLNGKYVTAEDVNMSPADMEQIAKETRYVTGLSEKIGGGGDPSPVTAYGVYMGMKASCKKVFGNDALEGKRVVVQGVGHVGMFLLEHLKKENARIFVSDISEEKTAEAAAVFGAEVIEVENVYDLDVDIYSPNALGATINDDTINRIQCKIVAGGANNQLQDENKHGEALRNKGIVYAPDFLINAGGLINVGIDYLGGWSKDRVKRKVEDIYNTTLDILAISESEGLNTQEVALKMAAKRIHDKSKLEITL